jgi:hypothetical protein
MLAADRCPCEFTATPSSGSWFLVEVATSSDNGASDGVVDLIATIDARTPSFGVSVNAGTAAGVDVKGRHRTSDGSFEGQLLVPQGRVEYSWTVRSVSVVDGSPGSVFLATTTTETPVAATNGTTVGGCGLVITLPGAGRSGELGDVVIEFSVEASSPLTSEARNVVVAARPHRGAAAVAADSYVVDLTVTPPQGIAYQLTHPMDTIDPEHRSERCKPVAGWRVDDVDLAYVGSVVEITSGKAAALDLVSHLNAHWRVYPDDERCDDEIVADLEQRGPSPVRWTIETADGISPPVTVRPCGPDACFVFAGDVAEERTCTVTGTASFESYLDPSGHGPVVTKTVSIPVTVSPLRVRPLEEAAPVKPLAGPDI